jgi:ribosomal protein S18 acetylase RimI-like enzyme
MSLSIDLADVRRLEELAFRGWPALETRDVAGWRLRFAGAYTKRANSINALGPEARTDLATLQDFEAAYRARGQAPVWRLSPLAPPAMNDILTAPGYRIIERSLLQVCPLRADFAAHPDVRLSPRPTPAWTEAFSTFSPVRPEHRDIMRRMLAAIAAPACFAFVEAQGRPMALAIGAVQGDHMGLFDVLVMPHARRRGLARKVTESLYAWALSKGARFAYLQVVATNEAALALYAAQGFRTAYAYEYRIPASP